MTSRILRFTLFAASLFAPAGLAAQAQEGPLHPVLLQAAELARIAKIPPEWHIDAKAPAFVLAAGNRTPSQAQALARTIGVPLAPASVSSASANAKRAVITIVEPSIQGDTARVGVMWAAPGWLKDLKDRPVETRTCIFVFAQNARAWSLERSLCSAG